MSSKKARFMARMSPTSNSTSQEGSSSSSSNINKTSAAAASALSSFSGLTNKDVIMGRGAQATDHQGNKALRGLVRDRYSEYMETSKHKEKQRITQEIIKDFQRQGGRFLRPILPPNAQLNAATVESWEVVTDEKTIIDKVKQMLRDVRPETELKRKLRKRKRPLDEVTTTEGQPPSGPDSISNESSNSQALKSNAILRQGAPEPMDHTTNNSLSMPVATRQPLTHEGSHNRESNTLSLQDLAFIVGEGQRRQVLAHHLAQAEQVARLNSMRALFDLQHPHAPSPAVALNHGYLLPTNTMGARHAFPQFATHNAAPAIRNSNTGPHVTWEEILRQQRAPTTGAFHEEQGSAEGSARPPEENRQSNEKE
eukprot:scaffold37247_cov191-Amphora_coffeaeformis.AAC.4